MQLYLMDTVGWYGLKETSGSHKVTKFCYQHALEAASATIESKAYGFRLYVDLFIHLSTVKSKWILLISCCVQTFVSPSNVDLTSKQKTLSSPVFKQVHLAKIMAPGMFARKLKADDTESETEDLLEPQQDPEGQLLASSPEPSVSTPSKSKPAPPPIVKPVAAIVSKTGLMVLLLLAVQNCSKNLLMRYVMKDRPEFLTSAAVLGSEATKLTLSVFYILFIQRKPFQSILTYLKEDKRNTMLLAVPASAYNLQMSLEFVALANLDAAVFSVLVQIKLLFTATFSFLVLHKKLKYIQVISLALLTTGVMLCNLSKMSGDSAAIFDSNTIKGITATLGIAVSSGFASVYTEKVIKGDNVKRTVNPEDYGLAYTQVQLALMSLLTIGIWACYNDFSKIQEVRDPMIYRVVFVGALSNPVLCYSTVCFINLPDPPLPRFSVARLVA
jgi:UDP-sugar transporter A1/2/3